MNPAPNLVLVGPMGAGKTSVGQRLAARLGLRFVDADAELERRAGMSVAAIFETEGEAGFRTRERALLAELCAGRGQLLATGGGAVLEEDNRTLLTAHGFVVWLRAGVATQLARLAEDDGRPLLQGADREAVLERLAAQRDPLYARIADLVFDNEGLSPDAAAAALQARLREGWTRTDAAA